MGSLAGQIGLGEQGSGLVIAACSKVTLAGGLRELAANAPEARLVVVLDSRRALWEARAATVAGRASAGQMKAGESFLPRRALIRFLRRRKFDVAVVLADEDRSPSRWAQVLALLSGAQQAYVLPTGRPGPIRVSARSLVRFLAWRLYAELWETTRSLPAVGLGLNLVERATVETYRRAGFLRSRDSTPRPIRVLLIRSAAGASTRYRMDNKREQLELLGVGVTLRSVREYLGKPLRAARDAADHDVAIVHRLPHPGPADPVLYAFSRAGKAIVYDIDDLLFAPALVRFVPRQALRGVRQQAELLAGCSHVVAATEDLAQRLREQGRAAWVIGNTLSRELLSISSLARSRRKPHVGVRLGYLSGSPTHDRDLAVIGAALAEILQRHSDASLVLVGPVALPKELAGLGDRVSTYPMIAWRDLPAVMAGLDVNLAPLEMDNAFCQAKSELKYVEAGAVGIPTVATPIPAFRKAISPGVNGFLAETREEWCAALDLLVRRPDRRREVAEAARRDVETRYIPEQGAEELAAALSGILGVSRWYSRPGCQDARGQAAAAGGGDRMGQSPS